jgi:hypothetical protein
MNPTWPLTGNPIVLQRLASLYLIVFWALTAAFYISLVHAGYDPKLALLSCSSAGIACLLLRWKRKADSALKTLVADGAWHLSETGRALKAETQLILHLNDLLLDQYKPFGELGLTLVTVNGPEGSPASSGVTDLVRKTLFRETDARIFEWDGRSFTFAERRPNVAQKLNQLADTLESELQSLHAHAPQLGVYSLTVGMTVASDPACTPTDLLVNARASRRYAEARGRGRFVCKV